MKEKKQRTRGLLENYQVESTQNIKEQDPAAEATGFSFQISDHAIYVKHRQNTARK